MLAEQLLHKMALAVVNMDEDQVAELAQKAIKMGIPAQVAMEKGLIAGMEEVGTLFAANKYFIPEVVVCSDAMYAGLNILRPQLGSQAASKGRIVIGVVEGDTHDIGKNIVIMMLEGAGFDVHDLGRNIPLSTFAERALDTDADIVAVSSLMTTTMEGMRFVVEDVKKRCTDRKRYVIVGGAPVSLAFAQRIGADGYASDAAGAVRLVRSLLKLEVPALEA